MNNKFHELFKKKKPIIGMIHLAGDDYDTIPSDINDTIPRALKELEIFQEEGLDGAIIENYLGTEEQVEEVLKQTAKKEYGLVIGVNILPNEYFKSMSLARKYGAKFVQLDYVAGKYLNCGIMNGRIVRFEINSEDYELFRKNHSDLVVLGGVHPKGYTPAPESNLEEELKKGIERADAIVVTGRGTGIETPIGKIKEFREKLGDYPLIVGAGLTPENAYEQLSVADGAIVGSALKTNNKPVNHVDGLKVRDLMSVVRYVKNGKRIGW